MPMGLLAAIGRGSLAEVQAALDGGADPDGGSDPGCPPLWHALERAAHGTASERTAQPAIARALLASGADPSRAGVLPLAARADDEAAVELAAALLDAGVPVDQRSDGGWTALMYAVVQQNVELVRLLMGRGARTDLAIDGDETDGHIAPGTTAAQYAAANAEVGEMAAIRELIGAAEPLNPGSMAGTWRLVGFDAGAEIAAYDDEAWFELHPDGSITSEGLGGLEGSWSGACEGFELASEDGGDLDPELRPDGRMWVDLLGERCLFERNGA